MARAQTATAMRMAMCGMIFRRNCLYGLKGHTIAAKTRYNVQPRFCAMSSAMAPMAQKTNAAQQRRRSIVRISSVLGSTDAFGVPDAFDGTGFRVCCVGVTLFVGMTRFVCAWAGFLAVDFFRTYLFPVSSLDFFFLPPREVE